MPHLIRIKNVVKEYTGKQGVVRALDDVSLDVNRGEVLGLLGINGAGKTTLSSILATLHPPTSGDVLFNDKSIYGNVIEYRKHLGYCAQKPNLDSSLDVRQNLVFAGRYYLMDEKDVQARADELLAKFN